MNGHRTFAVISGAPGLKIVLCGLLDVENEEAKQLIDAHGVYAMNVCMKSKQAEEYLSYRGIQMYIQYKGKMRYAVGYVFEAPLNHFWDSEWADEILKGCFDEVEFCKMPEYNSPDTSTR